MDQLLPKASFENDATEKKKERKKMMPVHDKMFYGS